MARTGLLFSLCLLVFGCEGKGEALVARGNALAAKGELDEAAKAYDEGAKLLPNDSRPLELLGNVKLEVRDVGAARIAFEQALKINPSSVDSLLGLGRLEGQAGRLDQALQYLAQAVDKAPDRQDVRSWRAAYLVTRGAPADVELALKDVDHALSAQPDDPSALYVRGNALIAAKKYDDAKKSFEALAAAAPTSALADYGLARLAAAQGDRLGALAQLRAARDKSKNDPKALPGDEVRKDPAFRFLENDPDFLQLIPR